MEALGKFIHILPGVGRRNESPQGFLCCAGHNQADLTLRKPSQQDINCTEAALWPVLQRDMIGPRVPQPPPAHLSQQFRSFSVPKLLQI